MIGILGFGWVGFGIVCRIKFFGVECILYNDLEEIEYVENCV